MKDIGIYIGSFGAGTWLSFRLGILSKFHWWEYIFLAAMILAIVMIGGIFGMVIQELIFKIKSAWTGRKQPQKKHLLGFSH